MGKNFRQELQNFADTIFIEGQCRIIEGSESDKQIIESLGIKFPNPDLALFEGIYLMADAANKNRHFLSSDTVEKAVSTIKMKPVNYFHKREQPIGVYINGTYDKSTKSMRTVGILWRSLFPEKVKDIEALIKSSNSGQSFELTYQKSGIRPDTNIELFDVTFKGGAILPRDKAACVHTSADVLAKALQDESVVMGGITQTEKGGEKTMTIEEILIAEEKIVADLDNEKIEGLTFDKQSEELHKNEEETVEYTADAVKLTYQERQGLPDSAFAYVKVVGGKKVRRFPIQDEAHVRNALARLPQAKGLSPAERAAIKAKILRKAKSLGMTSIVERHKGEACFTYEDVASFIDELTQSYANHIAPDKLEEVIAERVKKYLEDKAKAEKDAADKVAKYDERRKTLEAYTDEELKAFDILNDEVFDKLTVDNKIKVLQRNVSDLNWLKMRVQELEKPQGSAQGAEETPEQKTAREAKEVADKAEVDRVAKEKADADVAKVLADKAIADKVEADRLAKEKTDKDAQDKIDADNKIKEADEKAKKDAEGKLLVHGMPKVVDESVKTQMKEVTQKREDK
jgi:hypothetical protein